MIVKGEKVTVWLNGELVVNNVTLDNYRNRKQAINSFHACHLSAMTKAQWAPRSSLPTSTGPPV